MANPNPSPDTRFGGKRGNTTTSGGRPAALKGLRVKCRGIVDELVVRRWAYEVEIKGPEWVECSKLLAAYGYGKPESFADEDEPAVQTSALNAKTALKILQLMTRHEAPEEETEH